MSWPLVALKDCCTVVGGATPKREVESYWDSQDIPWVTPKDISKIKSIYLDDAPEYISQKGFDSCAAHKLPEGSLLLTSRAPIGNVAITTRELCTNQGFKSLVPSESVDIKYLYFCMLYSAERLENEGNGATFKEVSKKVVEAFKIPLPPLETQKKIAAVLEKADQLRKDCKLLEQELNSLAQSVFIDMFGDPVTNPKGWDVKPISSLLSQPLQNGAYYPKEDYSDVGVEMVHMGDVFYDFIPRGGMKRVNASKKDIEKYKLTSNDLLISRRSLMLAGAAKPSLIEESNEDLIFESSMIRLTPNNEIINVMYLFYYLSNPIVKQHYIYQYITGATIKGINQSNLEKVEVLVPDYKLQESFLRIEQKIRNQKNELSNLATEYEANFNSLMQKAFKGELDL
ncbi:restriction endonuclease subunit S [Vibrio metschnikovii]|uniref:restriction endonuclease subunit S n=1 Tax=Vibrio metschnikovii TaxID=28172 RepID=UPI001C3047D2|nr:restriction endonuclease subunit S [Vibrio metschnikovii]